MCGCAAWALVFGMQAIAERTKLPEQEVELLLMKSLSLGLVKGIISGVERCQFFLCDIIPWTVSSLLRRPGFKSPECCASARSLQASNLPPCSLEYAAFIRVWIDELTCAVPNKPSWTPSFAFCRLVPSRRDLCRLATCV